MSSRNRQRHSPAGYILWAVLALIVAGIAALVVLKKPREPLAPPPEKAVAVRVSVVEPRALTETIRLPMMLGAYREVMLGAEKGGRIVELNAEKGAVVGAGDVLARVDDRQWEVNLRRAQIEQRDALKEAQRWQALKETGAVSGSDYDAVVRRRELAQAAVAEATLNLDQCRTRAPIRGRVEERYVETGEYVPEGAPLFKLLEVDRLKALVDVPEKDIGSVRVGDRMRLEVPAGGGNTLEGEVVFAAAQADTASNCFRLELAVDNTNGLLRAGMLGEALLVRRRREAAMAVPLAAVIPRQGEHVVFVVRDGRAVRRVVRIEAMGAEEAVVSSGLDAGDELVVEGHRALRDGVKVELR
jgi:membrane fusion protein (multidrug efflux system)